MADGRIIFDTSLDKSGLQKGLKGIKSDFSGLQGMFSKFGKAAIAAFSVKAIYNFGKQCVTLGSNVAEVQNVVDTAFGGMAYKIEDFAKTSVQNFGMSQLSAKQTASSYMAMAKGMNLAEDKASDLAIQLTGLSGDMASFYNITQEEAKTALSSVFTGETETLKRYGILLTETNLQEYARQQGISKSITKMNQQEKVLLRYNYVLNATRLANGDFIRTQDSWANQTRILSEQWKQLMAILGQGMIQVFTPLVKMLNQVVGHLINVANAASEAMSALFGTPAKKTSAAAQVSADLAAATETQQALTEATKESAKAAKNATLGFDELNIISQEDGGGSSSGPSAVSAPTVGGIVSEQEAEKAEGVAKKIKTVFGDITAKFRTTFYPAIEAWGKAFSDLKNPVQKLLGSIKDGLSTLWKSTLKPLGKFISRSFVPDIVNSFSVNLAPVFSDVLGVAVEEFGNTFKSYMGMVSKVVQDVVLPALRLLKTVYTDVFASFKTNWDKYGQPLISGFKKAVANVREIITDLYNNYIKPIISNLIANTTRLWSDHLKPLWDNVVAFFMSVYEAGLSVWNNFLAPIVKWLTNTLGPVIAKIVKTAQDSLFSAFGVISDVVSGILRSLKGLMTFITGVFTGDWKKAWRGIKDIFGGIWDGLWSIVKTSINRIIDGLNSLWSAVYKVFKGIIDGIGKATGWIGDLFGKDWGFSMPSYPPRIPKLAQGKVIPPNREFLAVLGDQKSGTNIETPLDTMIQAFKAALSEGGYGGETAINLNLTLDGDVVYRNQERVRQQRGTKTVLNGAFAR